MKQINFTQKWVQQAVPTRLHEYLKNLEDLATTQLEAEAPYHSFRILPDHFKSAGHDVGRLVAWSVSITTQAGWEYDTTSNDGAGTMWFMFKNPYVFS